MPKKAQIIEVKSEDAKEALQATLTIAEGKIPITKIKSLWEEICSPDHPTAPLQKRFKGEMLEEIRVNILNQLVKDMLRNPPMNIKAAIITREIKDIPERDNKKIVPNSFHKAISWLVYLKDEEKLGVINATKTVKNIEELSELEGNIEFSVKLRSSLDADIPHFIYDETSSYKQINDEKPDTIKLFRTAIKNMGKEVKTIVDILQEYEGEGISYDDFEVMRLNIDYSKPLDKDKFRGSVMGVSDISTDPENQLHRTSLMATYEDGFKYGRHSQIFAMVHPSVQTEGDYAGITLNADFIIPIAVMENNIKPVVATPPDAVDATEELYDDISDEPSQSNSEDVDCQYFGIGYDDEDEGCQECPVKDECKAKSLEA